MLPAYNDSVLAPSDSAFLQAIVSVLQAGGEPAERMRQALTIMIPTTKHQLQEPTGKDVIAFFQNSPLVGVELDLIRDKTPLRDMPL